MLNLDQLGPAPNSRPTPGSLHIVDDDPGIRRSLSRALRAQGYLTSEFPSGSKLLEGFVPSSPAAILVDMRMPIVTGLDLLRRFRALEIYTPFIFISGETSSQEAVAAMKEGAFDFLFKPVAFTQLLKVIDSALEWDVQNGQLSDQRRQFIARLETLTPRERELCTSIARDDRIKEIAAQFQISEATVKIHKARILDKLDSRSPSELALNLARFKPERI